MDTTHADDDSIGLQLECPVPGCTDVFDSAQAVAGHVGNGHEQGWEDAVATPSDVHYAATMMNPGDALVVAMVEGWLERNDVPSDAFQIYIHQGYGNVQLRHIGDGAALGALIDAVSDADAYHYNGDVGWFDDEFVCDLPQPSTWEVGLPMDDHVIRFEEATQCEVDVCGSERGVTPVVNTDGHRRRLCRSHAKHFLGVTS